MAYIVTDQEIDSSSKDARRHRCAMRACHAPTNCYIQYGNTRKQYEINLREDEKCNLKNVMFDI